MLNKGNDAANGRSADMRDTCLSARRWLGTSLPTQFREAIHQYLDVQQGAASNVLYTRLAASLHGGTQVSACPDLDLTGVRMEKTKHRETARTIESRTLPGCLRSTSCYTTPTRSTVNCHPEHKLQAAQSSNYWFEEDHVRAEPSAGGVQNRLGWGVFDL